MIPWSKLPKEAQKPILLLIVLSSSASVTTACVPTICDPAPPPTTARPTPIQSPIICDPAPPPSAVRPTAIQSPIICDPAPPPSVVRSPAAPTPTARTQPQTFRVLRVDIHSDPSVAGAAVQIRVVDGNGNPVSGQVVTITAPQASQRITTDPSGEFYQQLIPGVYVVTPASPTAPRQSVEVKPHDVAVIEFQLLGPTPTVSVPQTPIICDPAPPPATPRATGVPSPTPMICDPAPFPSPASHLQPPAPANSLPLAEIRTVELVWAGGMKFNAETPWPNARYRWSASGGELDESGARVTWQPPGNPGRYLVQVVADWGAMGLAVDSIVLTVQLDGSVVIG